MKWLILILGIASNAAASIIIKYAGSNIIFSDVLKEPWKILLNYTLLLGIFFYFFAFILYILALKVFPLHIAHPILTSGAIAIVAIFSFLFFKEPFSITKIFGIICILIGVFVLTRG